MKVMNNCNLPSTPQQTHYLERCDIAYRACYTFNQDQFYAGDFFRDSFHGQGSYTWNELAVYEGGFYSNFKEGYASLSFPDNTYFEGLFIRNKPFGPGILTYANGRQDAGFWRGQKLVRLSRAVDFIVPRLAPTSTAKIKLLQFRRLIPLDEEDCNANTFTIKQCGYSFENISSPYSRLIYDPRSIFFDKQAFEKPYFVNVGDLLKEFSAIEKSEIIDGKDREFENSKEKIFPLTCLCQKNDSEETDFCDKVSFHGEYELGILGYLTKYEITEGLDMRADDESGNMNSEEELEKENIIGLFKPPKIVSWNKTELCTEMIKQMFRYRKFEDKLSFDVAKIMLGARTAFRKTGYKEKECVHFLKMCSIGPAQVVKDLLCCYEISEELMDARGNNSLMFAAATDQHAVIDVLLNYGVDVNSFNDEGLTPLNLCLLRRLALANRIFCWETAFLPEEIATLPDDFSQLEEWQAQESVESLDRIFGDGMSLNDSKTRIFNTRFLTPFPIPYFSFESNEINNQQTLNLSDTNRGLIESNQTNKINISKSPGSYSLVDCAKNDLPEYNLSKRSITSPHIRNTPNASQISGTTDETPKVNAKMIPRSYKRDEFEKSIQKAGKDKYLFEISFAKNQKKVESVKDFTNLNKKRVSEQKKELKLVKKDEEVDKDEFEMESFYFEMLQKIAEVDKTIQKLLKQGADPNISEVPKPSIHLAIYTKDLNTVHNLLLYGADPNGRLYSNEGLLTPLHVLALQKSAREFVDICGLLLNLGANPNKETHPEFAFSEEEKQLLDFERGRTPLELLCMRPDVEYDDPDDNLIKIGLMLARNSNTKRFYNGHSCLTLAMHSGNIKLLKALLESNLFDPNEILEKDRGTTLHVLVSRELQKKTYCSESIKMCNLLIKEGANPLKKFNSPLSLLGNCLDYGYREIEAEKADRNQKTSITNGKKESGKATKASVKSETEKTGLRDYLKDHEKVVEYLGDVVATMLGKKGKSGADLKKKKRKGETQDDVSKELQECLKEDGKASQAKEKTASEGKEAEMRDESKKKQEDEKDMKKKDSTDIQKYKGKEDAGEDQKEKAKKKENDDLEEGKGKKNVGDQNEKAKNRESDNLQKSKKKGKARVEDDELKGKPEKKTKQEPDNEKKQKKDKRSDDGKKPSAEKKERINEIKNLKGSSSKLPEKTLSKHLGSCSESFPEKLRQNLLKKYGNCMNIDINEFLIPYVVLRNGDLYYKFRGEKLSREEQYSLI